ncbi:MAG: hypothetical protein J6A21_08700 [Lentisphaeria bacterium]|nr:hypothetical protein [Lentisphaeria bacterium]
MRIKRRIFRNCFTLVEVIVSMAVFSLLMLGLMQFFSSAQNLWSSTGNRVATFGDARTAMNLMATDLMCTYYEEGYTNAGVKDHRYFFIVQDPAFNDNAGNDYKPFRPRLSDNRFKGFAFATERAVKAHHRAVLRLTEVFYRKNGNILETMAISDYQVFGRVPWVRTAQPTRMKYYDDGSAIDPDHPHYPMPFADLARIEPREPPAAEKDKEITWTPIASNVVRFYVKVFRRNSTSALTFSNIYQDPPSSPDDSDEGDLTKFPGFVSITLISVDAETARKLKAMLEADSSFPKDSEGCPIFENFLNTDNDEIKDTYKETPEGILLREKMQIFTRTVNLDRG